MTDKEKSFDDRRNTSLTSLTLYLLFVENRYPWCKLRQFCVCCCQSNCLKIKSLGKTMRMTSIFWGVRKTCLNYSLQLDTMNFSRVVWKIMSSEISRSNWGFVWDVKESSGKQLRHRPPVAAAWHGRTWSVKPTVMP